MSTRPSQKSLRGRPGLSEALANGLALFVGKSALAEGVHPHAEGPAWAGNRSTLANLCRVVLLRLSVGIVVSGGCESCRPHRHMQAAYPLLFCGRKSLNINHNLLHNLVTLLFRQ